MIQRLALPHTVLYALLYALAPGCAAQRGPAIPRTLSGVPTRSAFVPPTAYEALIRGEMLLAEGRPGEAVLQLELATTAPDEDAYLLGRLATAQLGAGDRAGAEQTLAHAERIDACGEEVWLTRGALAESSGDPRAAQAAYARAADCAPRSPRGLLEGARLAGSQGDDARALTLLSRASERPYGERLEPQLARALAEAKPAALGYALASLGTHRAPDERAFAATLELALKRGLPQVALRAHEQQVVRIPRRLEAAILLANARREALAELLAKSSADELGGPAEAARFALAAGSYDRAELEATSALEHEEADALHALRAEALLGLGDVRAALEDVRAIREVELRRAWAARLLAETGAEALAAQLSPSETSPSPR